MNQTSQPLKKTQTITVPRQEFLHLKRQAQQYQNLLASFFELPLQDPIVEIVKDFKQTDLYSDEFLNDLESGLRKSSYAKKYAHKTSAV